MTHAPSPCRSCRRGATALLLLAFFAVAVALPLAPNPLASPWTLAAAVVLAVAGLRLWSRGADAGHLASAGRSGAPACS